MRTDLGSMSALGTTRLSSTPADDRRIEDHCRYRSSGLFLSSASHWLCLSAIS